MVVVVVINFIMILCFSIVGCPYSSTNMHKETILPDRVVTVFKPHYATEPMETETALTSSKSSLLTV